MMVIIKVTTIKFIVQKCIVVSLLRQSAMKFVVIGSIKNIHMKTLWASKLSKRSSHKGTHVDSNISIEKSHLPLIATSVVKKKQ